MKLTIKTKSPLLAGSGEGTGLIDADASFHTTGFPYIPARRVKGRLKTSAIEVLEIIRNENIHEDHPLIQSLFGKKGHESGNAKLKIPNLYLPAWEDILEKLEAIQANGNDEQKQALSSTFIRQYYTQEITQTAVEANGVAKEHSLRNYRTVRPGLSFEADIITTIELTPAENALVYLATLNLRTIGTRRNRGFGQVESRLCNNELTLDNTVSEIENWEKDSARESFKITKNPLSNPSQTGNRKQMDVTIKLNAPVLLSKDSGEQNTVHTDLCISGSRIRGVIARQLIEYGNLGNEAHQSPLFYQAILSGEVVYDFAWPTYDNHTGQPVPMHWQKPKGQEEFPKATNIFKQSLDNGKNAGYIGYKSGDHYFAFEPDTGFMFHHTQDSRIAGRSQDGGIFYYESLSPGQIFKGAIKGDEALLQALQSELGKTLRIALGRSRSAQYADATIELGEIKEMVHEDIEQDENKQYILTCQSPLVLCNEFGNSAPTASQLQKYLRDHFNCSVKIKKAVTAFSTHEHYVGIWKSKTPGFNAFKEGSSFLFEVENPMADVNEKLQLLQKYGLGEYRSWGYGKLNIKPSNDQESTIEVKPAKKKSNDYSKSIINPEKLKDIIDAYENKQKEIDIKTEAIDMANNFNKKLNNHLIGRMIRLIGKAESKDKLSEYLSELKDKPAGDKLIKTNHLFDDLWNRPYNLKELDTTEFKKYQLHWTTFFITLRKINKRNEQQKSTDN